MGEIIVTSTQLINQANELKGMNAQFKNAVENLKQEESALRSQYEGQSSDAFHSKFTRDAIQLNNFYNAIEVYVQRLQAIAQNYDKAEGKSVTIANG